MMVFHDHEPHAWCWCRPVQVYEDVWLHWESAVASSRTEAWLADYALPVVEENRDALEKR